MDYLKSFFSRFFFQVLITAAIVRVSSIQAHHRQGWILTEFMTATYIYHK